MKWEDIFYGGDMAAVFGFRDTEQRLLFVAQEIKNGRGMGNKVLAGA